MITYIEKKVKHLGKEGDVVFDEGKPFTPPEEDFRVLIKESGVNILESSFSPSRSLGVFSIGNESSLLGFSNSGKLEIKRDHKFIDGLNFEGGAFFRQIDIILKEYPTFAQFLSQHWEVLSITHRKQQGKPALFLDRDGVINEDCGYPSHINEIKIIPEIVPVIKLANEKGFPVIVITNQSGVARNYLNINQLNEIHSFMSDELLKMGAKVDEYLFCPFHPDGENKKYAKHSYFRKPGPLMMFEGGERHQVDFARSVMIGDKVSDALHAISLKTFILKSKYTEGKHDNNRFEVIEDHSELMSKVKSFFSSP